MFYPRFRAADRENNYIMYTQKAVNSRGESRPQLWVNVQLATRLGVIDQYCPILKGVSIDNYNQVAETLHQQAYELWAARADVKDIPGLTVPTWEEFNKKPILRVPIDTTKTYSPTTKNGLMIGLVDQIQNGKPFATKSGKIEFYSDYLATTDLSKTMWGIGPMPPMVQWVVPGSNYAPPPGVQGAPSGDSFWDPNVKNYPLYHMMPAAVFRQHSLHDNNPLLNDQYRHAVWISVPDAKARGIVDNDLVRVYNEVGEMILPAYVTSRIVPGVVCIHSGGWYLPSQVKTNLNPDGIDIRGNCNILTHDYLYPGMSMPGASLVEVQKF
jgi:anaerobic dimethyl sulfoxide reductase subunit A